MLVIIISSSIKFYKIFSYNASTTKFYKVISLLKIMTTTLYHSFNLSTRYDLKF